MSGRRPFRLDGRRRKFLHWGLMIFGYAAGQGALFISQTYLVLTEQMTLLANFGMSFSFAILGTIITDFGAQVVLARETVQTTEALNKDQRIAEIFWSATACRLAVAALVLLLGGLAAGLTNSQFFQHYALFAAPTFVIWAFNSAGILDGLRLSGLAGISGAFPYLSSALAVVCVQALDDALAGSVLGAALTLGYLATVIWQWRMLRQRGIGLRFSMPSGSDIVAFYGRGVGVLLTQLPGQIYFRIQLGLSASLLGEATTALLIYAKQVVSAFVMLGNFLRRIEFPDLVQSLKAYPQSTLRLVLTRQMGGTLFGVAGFLGVLLVSTFAAANLENSAAEAGRALTWFCVLIVTGSIAQATTQGLVASGRYFAAAGCNISAIAIGLGLSFALVPLVGLVGFAVADGISQTINAIIALVALFLGARLQRPAVLS